MNNNTSAKISTAESIIPTKKLTKKLEVVLTAYKQTSYADYTHIFKTVEIEIPIDGLDWHVAGEMQ